MLVAPRPSVLTLSHFKLERPFRNVNNNNIVVHWKRVMVTTKDTYSRIPMDTPGAYQLIDEDTGEKFIILGGSEDDSPIPSKQVLSWKPPSNTLKATTN
ncbi:hypothetical protein FXO38_20726 [Capsicum annuum]|uniref:Uncharacterized protein n=1 Tax=Capsicum annuum TaxID=4072 RepID=A0A2G2ZHL6_CAPAN|nr:hypothetical protein FXO38_20726 [Capsicum annuum]KAF3646239.1 hypothetical protein FXO37_20563 [Capsicum annuum]PHT81476.1 hypothetical protein T459_14491 [Capsicum annuum]